MSDQEETPTNSSTSTQIDSEQSKGYWTEGSSGYLDVAVAVTYTKEPELTQEATKNNSDVPSDTTTALTTELPKIATSTIVLSSGYWYRVQHFNLQDDSAWNWLKSLLRECGRKLPDQPQTPDAFVYRIGNLSLQQVNQMYYLIKHSLTTAKVAFELKHTLSIGNLNTVPAPKNKKNRRARRKNGARPLPVTTEFPSDFGWKIVGVNSK